MPNDLTDVFGEPIPVYTRTQAIADGVLVDVSVRARHFGLRYPVALTAALHHALTNRPESEDLQQLCVDLLLITLRQHIRAHDSPADRIDFSVKILHLPLVAMYALCTPGDKSEPVSLPSLLPHED